MVVPIAGAVLWLVEDDGAVQTSLSVAEALSADVDGYARASEPRPFKFPSDHGPHPDFRTEWWYYTGNLTTDSGRRFAYQLTLFRTALQPSAAAKSDSTWSTRQLYMGHFALSDPSSGTFHAFERFSRGAADLAGGSSMPYRIWLEDWEIEGATADTVSLRAREDGVAVEISLRRMKPIVLQGENGLDRKGSGAGNASYYYSMTRMATSGTVFVQGERYNVDGFSWLDREWSTSALSNDLVGWDWFSVHLDDGRDLMFYRLRRVDGSASPFSSGIVAGADSTVERLEPSDVELEPVRFWESPKSGASYPVEWFVRIPSLGMDLVLTPYLDHQELNHTITYWEGAVRIEGSHVGSGFVELTGYGQSDAIPRGL